MYNRTPHHPRLPRTSRFLLAALITGFATVAAPAWGQVIYEDLMLLASDGAEGDHFGLSIAIDNGVVAVGARWDTDNGWRSGSAYLFDASTGVQISKLLPSDGTAQDWFGYSIAIDNGIVGVGAYRDAPNGPDSGSAYLFDVATGSQFAKLIPSDGQAEDYFGLSIAIHNGVVAVGSLGDDDNGDAAGSAYLFDATTGIQIATLLPNDGAAEDWFGVTIAIDNGVVAVGANQDDDNGDNSGSAYLFDASTGIQFAKLLPSDGAAGDNFGYSVAIHDGVVAVGAVWDDDNGDNSGSAYLFDASTGAQIVKLLPTDGAMDDWFGLCIAINNGVVAVRADLDDDNGRDSGSAYLFDASTGVQIAKLLPSDGAAGDQFGHYLAIDDGVVAIGAYLDDDNGLDSGSAYLFDVTSCPTDITGDLVVNTRDFIAFLNAWAGGDPLADWNEDGTIDTLDFAAYLNDWVAGCP